MSAGVCVFCSCTETTPCAGGCAWTTDAQDVCTQCFGAVEIATELVKVLGLVAASPKTGLRIATARWDLLRLDQQRLIVMSCRATIEGIREALLEGLGADAVAAGMELNVITGFLLEHFQDQIRENESASDAVIRLLEPHVGSRVLLPGAGV